MFNGSKLKALRNQHGYSLQHVATVVDSSKSYMWELERGKVEPSGHKVFAFAQFFNVPMESFYNEAPTAPIDILTNKITHLIKDYHEH